jgi:hypothetical protein
VRGHLDCHRADEQAGEATQAPVTQDDDLRAGRLAQQHRHRVAGHLHLLDLEIWPDLPCAGRRGREMAEDDIAQHRAVVDPEAGIADQAAGRPRMGRDEPQRQLPPHRFSSGPPHGLQTALRTVHTGDDRPPDLVLSHPVPPTRQLTARMPPLLAPRHRHRTSCARAFRMGRA